MDVILITIGDWPVTVLQGAIAAFGLIALLLLALLVIFLRAGQTRSEEAQRLSERNREMERHLADLMRVQSEMTGRVQTMSEIFGTSTTELSKNLGDRIADANHKMGQHLNENRSKTEQSLAKLNERLAVIDRAQSNITQLSSEIVSLQSILSNKQQRGAFGQGRMEAIVADGLPSTGYGFQVKLSNGNRPDCVIFMPNDAPPLVIDAKFPLEAWQRLREPGESEGGPPPATQFRRDLAVHVKAISEKYLLVGETQDTAFMFVPSEAIFADIHEKFEDVVQAALRARVVIVSPSLLMLSIQVVQALLRDVKMREQAHVIQKEVIMFSADVR